MNVIILSGRLGRDTELKYTNNGKPYLTNALAVDRGYKGKQGETVTDWFNISAFGKTAELMNQYLGKGRKVLVEGQLQTNVREDNQGNRTTYYNVVVQRFEFMDTKPEGQSKAVNNLVDNSQEVHVSDNELPF